MSPGSLISGYRVISLLGSGGMGEVYLVENPHLLRREALKVISLAGAHDPDFQRRFTNEARTTASLDHPSIISIHQYGINENDAPWFTMNYLEGKDLAEATISPRDVGIVATRVADALDYAHRHQVIHRDIKPANIIVSRDATTDTIDRVTVLDFGIAKLVNSATLTATSAFIGTLAYCAPEVIEGHDATALADQYSLACTVFQLLTGRAPFTTTTPSALVMAHLTKPIPAISSLRGDLAALDPVLAKSFAKDPAARYPDCRSFAAALNEALSRQGAPSVPGPVPTPPAPTPQPTPGPTTYPPRPTPYPPAPTPYPPAQTPPPPPGPTYPPRPTPYPPGPLPTQGPQPAPFPPPGPAKKKRTGLIVGLVAAAAVVILVAGLGIAFATGAFSSDTKSEMAVKANVLASAAGTTCVVVDGNAHCWGSNSDGQLGDGSTTNRSTPATIAGLSDVSAVAAGGYGDHITVCAVAGGEAYCWGNNHYGQVGDGTSGDTSQRNNPTRVGDLTGVTAIATSYGSTCAIAGGDVYCWGDNDKGQLGISADSSLTPTKVTGISNATSISTDRGTTCAIADGLAYCWGDNSNGQIGNGSTSRQNQPVQVSDLTGVDAIEVGSHFDDTESDLTVCATAGGSAYCWGDNTDGQLGNGTTTSTSTPAKVSTLTDARMIANDDAATCAIADSKVYCWGSNDGDRLGIGGSTSNTPREVNGITGTPTAITTGYGTTCVLTGGDVYCWGSNTDGQVGSGTISTTVSTPTKVNL